MLNAKTIFAPLVPAPSPALNADPMKKSPAKPKTVREVADDEILPEYDFSNARRNPYAQRYAEGTNVILLDPDVARDFPDSASVNEALRALTAIIRRRKKARRTA